MITGVQEQHRDFRAPLRDQVDQRHAFGLKARGDAGRSGVAFQYFVDDAFSFGGFHMPSPSAGAPANSRLMSRSAASLSSSGNTALVSSTTMTINPAPSSALSNSGAGWRTMAVMQPRSNRRRSSKRAKPSRGPTAMRSARWP